MGPLQFTPLFMTRVWGGRTLEKFCGKALPDDGQPYGESWEIVDRDDAQSRVVPSAEHPLGGMSLHDLWTSGRRREIFGDQAPETERFPLLLKILDAREDLSLQVHPPAGVAAQWGGEPKTEMWYIAQADPGAAIFAGVQPGTTRESFAAAMREGAVAGLVHKVPVRTGDSLFIPSGRLHAIGAGLVIFEIQQNSDTTYRVFDWNRLGLDGKPRALHAEAALRSIDFSDTAPAAGKSAGPVLADCPHFRVLRRTLRAGERSTWGSEGEFSILAVADGRLEFGGRACQRGDHLAIPACLTAPQRQIHAADNDCVLLEVQFGRSS
jgi:mannose-6-phosphate isomerase